MPYFSELSKRRLAQCDVRLQLVFQEVIKKFDCIVLCGYRNEADQNASVKAGHSKTKWPASKHNKMPSLAVDVAPFERPGAPVNWEDRERMTLFAGFVLGMAESLGVQLRWGGDWDRDTQVRDNAFDDLVHFELV